MKQRDGRSDFLTRVQQDLGPVSEQSSGKPRSKSVERKPSMKIVVTGKSIENPTPKRTATIIRVNSTVSGMFRISEICLAYIRLGCLLS